MRKNNKYLNCHTEEGRSPDVSISVESEYNKPRFPRKSFRFALNDNNEYSRDCHVASLLTMTMVGLFSFNAHGECTPTPDCASIGYTQTSCETDYLACPFDSTKLKCIPCDSSFRYDCSGDDFSGGDGNTCNGKYASCSCSSTDYIFSNGSCICDTSCKVGAIYYSDGTCSACVDNTKTAIGVVVKDNELIISQISSTNISWGGYGTDISDIDTLDNFSDFASAITDFNGKNNTTKIVDVHTSAGLTSSNSAAVYCNSYSTKGTNSGDWYLPAAGELLNYESRNFGTIRNTMGKLGWTFNGRTLWSSSERDHVAWCVNSDTTASCQWTKDGQMGVTCFLPIN